MIRAAVWSRLAGLGCWLGLLLGLAGKSWGQGAASRFYLDNRQPHHYVLVSDSLGPLHHIHAQRGGYSFVGLSDAWSGAERGKEVTLQVPTTRVEILNLLLPAARLPRAATPTMASTFQPGDTLLITFSLLPDTSGTIRWERVQLDTLAPGRQQSLTQAVAEACTRLDTYRQRGSPGEHTLLCRDDLIPLVRRAGAYWAPQAYVLTQYYQIRTRPSQVFPATDQATINIRSRPFPTEQLLAEARRKRNNPHAQLYTIPAGNVLQERTETYYEFWSNPSVWYSHPPPLHYGNGGFRYRPGLGLVSARNTFYFANASGLVRRTKNDFFEVLTIDGKAVR